MITADESLAATDYGRTILINSTAAVTVGLPIAFYVAGQRITLKRTTGSGTTTVNAPGGNLVDGGTVTLTGALHRATFESDGSNWWQVA